MLTGFFTSLACWLDSMSYLLGFFSLVDWIILFSGLLAGFYVFLFTSLFCWLDSLPYWLLFSAHLQSSSPCWPDSLPHLLGLWPALYFLLWSVAYVADGQVCRFSGHQWDMFMMTRLVNLSKVLWDVTANFVVLPGR